MNDCLRRVCKGRLVLWGRGGDETWRVWAIGSML
jgi:hypothetical protein